MPRKLTRVKSYCRDDISKIENYELAKADNFVGWECHHRNELTVNGEFAHTAAELKQMNMYYNRPYFELIFLRRTEHCKLHTRAQKRFNILNTPEVRAKNAVAVSKATKTQEYRDKMSKIMKGRKFSEEHRKNLRKAWERRKSKICSNK